VSGHEGKERDATKGSRVEGEGAVRENQDRNGPARRVKEEQKPALGQSRRCP